MHSLAPETDVRAMNVVLDDARLVVDLMDGRTIAVPLAWYPRLANATPEQRNHWQLAGGGYGIHWPDIDEDLSTEGLLRGARAPQASKNRGQTTVFSNPLPRENRGLSPISLNQSSLKEAWNAFFGT